MINLEFMIIHIILLLEFMIILIILLLEFMIILIILIVGLKHLSLFSLNNAWSQNQRDC